MWKWLEKTKSIKGDLLNFKDEPLSSISVVLLIILDIFIFTNVMIGVEGETAKVPAASYYYPSDCSKHFKKVQTEYKGFSYYRYGQSRSAHLRPHLSEYCQDLDVKIEGFSQQEAFKSNLKSIETIENKQRQNAQRLEQISSQYNTRLFESIAKMPNNSELVNAKNEYDEIIHDNKRLKEELALIPSVSTLEGYDAYAAYVNANKTDFMQAKKSYSFWQPFKAYGHMLIFVLPLLLFFGYFYRRTKSKQLAQEEYNPVVKIISAHIALILALPLVWYTLGLIYHVLPKTLLKRVIEFLVEIGLLSLLNYVAILLVVLFFGGLIYWIQKRTLKQKLAVKYTKNYKKLVSWSQCFECEYKIDYTKPFCPFCGVSLHEECASCGEETNVHELFCSSCGESKSGKPPL
jgi:hypothetical protein